MQQLLQLKIIRLKVGSCGLAARHAAQRVIRKAARQWSKGCDCAAPGQRSEPSAARTTGTVFTGRGISLPNSGFVNMGVNSFLSWPRCGRGAFVRPALIIPSFSGGVNTGHRVGVPQASAAMANNISITSGGMRTARRGLASRPRAPTDNAMGKQFLPKPEQQQRERQCSRRDSSSGSSGIRGQAAHAPAERRKRPLH